MMYTEQRTNKANPAVCETSVKKIKHCLMTFNISWLNKGRNFNKKYLNSCVFVQHGWKHFHEFLYICARMPGQDLHRKRQTQLQGGFLIECRKYSGIAKRLQLFCFARLCNCPRNLVLKRQPITVAFQRLGLVMGIYYSLSPCDIPLQLLIERCNYQGFGSLFQVVENHF